MDVAAVVSWGFAAIGMAFFAMTVWSVVAAERQATWAEVPGQIVRSQVEYRGEEFAADIEYTYSYDGCEYSGHTVRSAQLVYNWRGPAERICGRYPEGAVVVAYVNPHDPERSVLEPPSRMDFIATLVVSIIFFVLALVINLGGH